MKKMISSIFLSGLFAYAGITATYAQGRGGGHVPGSVGDPHAANSNSQAEHGKSGDADHHSAEPKSDQTFESRIENNPALKSRVESLLPAGMDLKTAAMGFRNEGQLIAALHVSKNLNIPFTQLQAKLTGDPPMSLGKAIQALRPNTTDKEAKAAAEEAEKQTKTTEKPKPVT